MDVVVFLCIALKSLANPADKVDHADDKKRNNNDLSDSPRVIKDLRFEGRRHDSRNEKSDRRINYFLKRHGLLAFLGDHPIDDVVATFLIDHLAPATRVSIGRSKNAVPVAVGAVLDLEPASIVTGPLVRVSKYLVGLGDRGKL